MMKYLLLGIIKAYWRMVPSNKRRKCIFRISCSRFVYETTKKRGLYHGLLAFHYRFKNCRAGYELYEDPFDGSKQLFLATKKMIREHEIAERLL